MIRNLSKEEDEFLTKAHWEMLQPKMIFEIGDKIYCAISGNKSIWTVIYITSHVNTWKMYKSESLEKSLLHVRDALGLRILDTSENRRFGFKPEEIFLKQKSLEIPQDVQE